MGAQLNLNLAPIMVEKDLNEIPIGEDLQEMLIHPVEEQLLQNEVQIPIHQMPEQHQVMAPKVAADNVVAAYNVNLNVNDLPQIQFNHLENFLHHEIPEDDLRLDAEEEDMDAEEENMDNQQEIEIQQGDSKS